MVGGGRTFTPMNKSCILVMVVAAVERFVFKGLVSNLVMYLTEVLEMTNSSAAKAVNSLVGLSFLLPLFGAILADKYFNRYSCILASSVVYVAGLVALTSTAMAREWIAKSDHYPTMSTLFSSSLFLSLFFIVLGLGGYNPCLHAFGADQLASDNEQLPTSNSEVEEDKDSEKNKSSFFNWWYFSISSGSLLGVTLMSYLQEIFGWGIGFAISTMAMGSSVAPFYCGSGFYRVVNNQPTTAAANPIYKFILSVKAKLSKIKNAVYSTVCSNVVDGVNLEIQEELLCGGDCKPSSSTDKIEVVDPITEKKSVLRLMPIWASLLSFAIIFQQTATFFTKQGMTMNRNIGNNITIPPATLQCAINVSILLLTPFYDRAVVPIFRLITGNKKGISVMQRMGFGMFLSIIAMTVAAVVERKRLEASRRIPLELPLSIFWLLPQYVLLGLSDVFTVVGMQDFFYSEVSHKRKTVGMAIYSSVFGVGSFLSALLILLIEILTSNKEGNDSWFADDMRKAHLDKFYWLLASLSAFSLVMYGWSCKYYNKGK